MSPTMSKDWVIVFLIFSLVRATDWPSPILSVCPGDILCCGGGYPENFTYRWLLDNVTYELGQSRRTLPTESTVQCAVQLPDSGMTTSWSNSIKYYLRPEVTQRNKTIQVQHGFEINFKCDIEMGNLTRRDQIEYISLTESCRNGNTNLLWWRPGQPANISAVYQKGHTTIKLEDLSVTLDNSRYGNSKEPLCVTCSVKLQREDDPIRTFTRIEYAVIVNNCETQTTTSTAVFNLNFTDGLCPDYKEGELIWHFMRKHTCLANSQFTVQVLCEEDNRTAVVVVTSSVVISEEIMSQTLEDIAVVSASHAPPPTTPLPPTPLPSTPPVSSESMHVFLYPFISACATSLLLLVVTTVLGVIKCGHKYKKRKASNTISPFPSLPIASMPTTPPTTPPMTPPPISPTALTEPPSNSQPSEDLPVSFLAPVGSSGPRFTMREDLSSRHRVRSLPVSAEGGAAQTAHVILPLNNFRRVNGTQLSRGFVNSNGGDLAMMPTYIDFNQSEGYGDSGNSCMSGYHHYPGRNEGHVNISAPSSTPLSSTHIAGDPIFSRCTSPVDCSGHASGLPAQNIAIPQSSTSGSLPMTPHLPPVQSVAPISYTSLPMPPLHVLPADRHTPEAHVPQYCMPHGQIFYSTCMPTYQAYQAMVISQPPPANTYPTDQVVASINPQTNRIEEMAAVSVGETTMPASYPETSINHSLTTTETSF